MKTFLVVSAFCVVLALMGAAPVFGQGEKETTFSGTNYWPLVSKVSPLDSDRFVAQSEIMGVRVNDSGDGLFHGAATYLVAVQYMSKAGIYVFRGIETWTDKDGDKVVWELSDTGTGPAGASGGTGKMVEGTGKYTGWRGMMDYTLQFPKSFPDGTRRGICRETVKVTTK